MKKKILIDANFPNDTRVVLLDKNNNIENIEFSSSSIKKLKDNIYLAKVVRVESALQAAFVDYGEDKNGFLPFSEIHPDYYNLLSMDRKNNTLPGSEITAPQITPKDLEEGSKRNQFNHMLDTDDLDIVAIEKMVNEKVQSNINIEASEHEVDDLCGERSESNVKFGSQDKKRSIQEVIKKGQILLIQITKEERGNKGVSATTYISLAGKYCVLMPNKPMQNGVSRKISNAEERKRLKAIISNLTMHDTHNASSVIARTAGAGHTSLEIKKDYDYLARLWNKIRETTLQATAPTFIHQEDGIFLKTIRDLFDHNVKEIMIHGHDAYKICTKYMNDILPDKIKSVKEYKGKVPIFTKFNIEDQLIKLYQPIVQLPSGGYIVINPTEALISIDINSGKSTNDRNVEEMALKTNLEAAREIARQARLRDLSGLLVLDFIDLSSSKNRNIVERSLWEYFSKDKARIQTSQISLFGLIEMSRQRLRSSFLEINSSICPHCSGKGVIRAFESNAMLILRTIENEIFSGKFDVINVYGISQSIVFLLNQKRDAIALIERKYNLKLNFCIDQEATSDSFSIEKIKLPKNRNITTLNQPLLQDTSEIYSQPDDHAMSTMRRKIDAPNSSNTSFENDVDNANKDLHDTNITISQENSDTSSENAQKSNIDATHSSNDNQNHNNKRTKVSYHKRRVPRKPRVPQDQVKASND